MEHSTKQKVFFGLFLLIIIGYWMSSSDEATHKAEQTELQRTGGTPDERSAMDSYCDAKRDIALKALPDRKGINSITIVSPTTSFMTKNENGHNVYLQEAVYRVVDENASWRCHRVAETNGWRDITVELTLFPK